jgi:putative tryptophan/tyrosine transport system substrate-binding protein
VWLAHGSSLLKVGAPTLLGAVHRRAAYYVDRILRGASPAALPVEQPMRFDLVVNTKAARELGLVVTEEFRLQVTATFE